jgi:radical SAM protein with 4Fe4S-binding SPASM domain
MVARQLASIAFFSNLTGWKRWGSWFVRHSFKSLPVAAGAIGMGCIGFPNHPVYEITNRCNLNCIHCHTSGGDIKGNELDTREAKKLIDGLAEIREFRMLVFTGGEPLVREDLFEILRYSKSKGFINMIATNGTLITNEVARDLKKAGVAGAAISLDSTDSHLHNRIRQDEKAFELAMKGIREIKKAKMLLQINTTAMEYNFDKLEGLIQLADDLDSGIMLMYQLVPVGRGDGIKEATLDLRANEKLIKYLAGLQQNISVVVETVAGPQYWPYLMEINSKNSPFHMKLAKKVFHGCSAGRGLVYIKADGEVWPCPFVELNAGDVRKEPVDYIWKNSEVFKKLRNREKMLKGKCGSCDYNTICGGCRGKALALSGDYLDEDKFCFIKR